MNETLSRLYKVVHVLPGINILGLYSNTTNNKAMARIYKHSSYISMFRHVVILGSSLELQTNDCTHIYGIRGILIEKVNDEGGTCVNTMR